MPKVFVNDVLVDCSDAAADELIKLRKDLAEREAECLKLREALLEYRAFFSSIPAGREALSAPPSTNYLEQWVRRC
jgi:hypothetical protein